MLQPAGDLGLDHEPLAAGRVVGVVVEDLLERDLAVQLAVECHEDGAQAAAGVGPQDAEPLAVAGRGADRQRHGAVVVGDRARSSPSRRGRASPRRPGPPIRARLSCVDLPAETAARLFSHVAAVGLQVNLGQRFQQRPLGGSQVAARLPGGRPGSWTCPASRPGRRPRAGPG